MNLLERQSRIYYGAVGREFYKNNRHTLDEVNYRIVRAIYLLTALSSVVLMLAAPLFDYVSNMQMHYAAASAVSVGGYLLIISDGARHKNHTHLYYYIGVSLILAFYIYAYTFESHDEQAVIILLLIPVACMIYIDAPGHSLIYLTVMTLLFDAVAAVAKRESPYIIQSDIINSTASLFVGVLLIVFSRSLLLENIKAKMKYEAQSKTDGLTGAYNKMIAEKECERFLNGSRSVSSALMIIDIDDFKKVNDGFGHKQGDQILSHMGRLLKNVFCDEDIVGRIGGDEFIVLMKDVSDINAVLEKASSVNRQITTELNDGSKVSCSIGIAMDIEGQADYSNMFARADKAMYKAKANGKDRYEIFTEGMNFQS